MDRGGARLWHANRTDYNLQTMVAVSTHLDVVRVSSRTYTGIGNRDIIAGDISVTIDGGAFRSFPPPPVARGLIPLHFPHNRRAILIARGVPRLRQGPPPGDPLATVIDCAHLGRAFYIDSSTTSTSDDPAVCIIKGMPYASV